MTQLLVNWNFIALHTAIATTSKGLFDAIQVPTEAPGQGEILLRVEYSSMVAFDIYMTDFGYHIQWRLGSMRRARWSNLDQE